MSSVIVNTSESISTNRSISTSTFGLLNILRGLNPAHEFELFVTKRLQLSKTIQRLHYSYSCQIKQGSSISSCQDCKKPNSTTIIRGYPYCCWYVTVTIGMVILIDCDRHYSKIEDSVVGPHLR